MNLTLANQLTILRMCLVPALAILTLYGHFGWSLGTFLLAGLTDALDGLMARMRKEKTQLGALLDPLADKLLVSTSLVVLSIPSETLSVRIPAWITILTISRDVGIVASALAITLAVGRRAFPPSPLGKATTAAQLASILWMFWCNYRQRSGGGVTDTLLALMVILTLASGLHYIYLVRQIIGEEAEAKG